MLCRDGVVSLYNFVITAFAFLFLLWNDITSKLFTLTDATPFIVPAVYFILVNVAVRLIYKGHDYQIAVRATFLGFVFAIGLYINVVAPKYIQAFGVYMCIMAAFHYSEFLTMAIIKPNVVNVDSYVLNHSPQYTIAALSSWLEFALECYFFPGLKTIRWLSQIGLLMCIAGEVIRKIAMLTASTNFNHLVQCEKADDHVLVTHGIYSWFRHPSYVGWFYWSIGTQLTLLNPFCTIAYTLASWFFFNERITIEEITLLNFFGQQYCDYQQKVGTGLPFIKGYKIKP